MLWLIFSAAIAAASPTAAPGEPVGDIPPCYSGVWSGSAVQHEGQRYPIIVALSRNGGSVEYPTLGCGGTLELVDPLPEGYVFRERLRNGRLHCSDGGRVTLHLVGRGRLHYRWEDARHESSAAGVLSRAHSIEAQATPNRAEALASANLDADEPRP